LAKNAGFTKIDEKPVQHQARKYGETKFGYERFLHGFLDLITLWFMSKFGKRPMHFFGSIGMLMFSIGFLSAAGIGISKLYKLYTNAATILITDNPWFFIALTTMIIGSLFFLAGFIGELILKYGHKTPAYRIAESLGFQQNDLQKNLL
ncbi:MAG: glycosyltransferase, partial [Flavobacteriaceae bacterium]|nr:glycosyltransferase [Flavobacteriaceae bacterium]